MEGEYLKMIQKNNKSKRNKGITITSLVIAIILLIILAGVTISLLFGKSGLIVKSKESQQIVDVATAQDRLELIKSDIPLKILENQDGTVNLKNYLRDTIHW